MLCGFLNTPLSFLPFNVLYEITRLKLPVDSILSSVFVLQTRDAILKGAHPVTNDEALQFAGLQCQIQFGDHVESKHKPGFLE